MHKGVTLGQNHITAIAVPEVRLNDSVSLVTRIAQISEHGVKHKLFMNAQGGVIHTALMLIETALLAKLCDKFNPQRKKNHAIFLCKQKQRQQR